MPKHERDDLRPVDQHLRRRGSRQFEVGRTIERALSLQIHDIAPSRISASPSVADGLDERVAAGERRAEQHAVDERDDAAERDADDVGDAGRPPSLLISVQAMNAPIAPTAPNARLSTPVAR